MRIESIESVT